MRKIYQYRINLNAHQKARFMENAGCSRWVYNYYLHEQIERTKQGLRLLSYQECLQDLKMQIQTQAWLQSVPIQTLILSLQLLMKNCQSARENHQNGVQNFPNFQRKKFYPKFYSIPMQAQDIDIYKGEVNLSIIGKMKIQIGSVPRGAIYAATLIEKEENEFFVSLHCKVNARKKYLRLSEQVMFGESFIHIRRTVCRLQRMRKNLSRKCEQSRNYVKEAEKIKKLEQHIQHQKHDFLHRQSKKWVQKNDIIIVKQKKGKLNRLIISDADCKEFLRLLQYKSRNQQKQIVILE